ncbi:MAG: DUF192 domain-containing protein [Synechococcaceae cyanobacterium RL_1_2]|nr:DUF192 domain-containing protein [Synechococcaceae cyanobacterium RL_1_2]
MVINQDGSQTLPISAMLTVGEEIIELEVASTPEQQAIGLMFRTAMAPNHGMAFNFPEARPVSFWMKNTLIPLDMLFVHQGEIRAIKANVPPCENDPCPSYSSGAFVDQVIELNAGRAEELGLAPGQMLNLAYLQP